MKPEQLRTTIYRLTLDWIHLKTQLPNPPRAGGQRRTTTREYGHPAEWASDKAAEISDLLHSWHDLLAEHRNEHRPPPADASEETRVRKAWQYLEPRCEQLIDLVEPEALQEMPELHHTIRKTLGYTRPRYTLTIPCPSDTCGLRTLEREVAVGQEFISCGTCGYTIKETHYPLLIRMTLDELLSR